MKSFDPNKARELWEAVLDEENPRAFPNFQDYLTEHSVELITAWEELDKLQKGIELAADYEFNAQTCGDRLVIKLSADELREVLGST